MIPFTWNIPLQAYACQIILSSPKASTGTAAARSCTSSRWRRWPQADFPARQGGHPRSDGAIRRTARVPHLRNDGGRRLQPVTRATGCACKLSCRSSITSRCLRRQQIYRNGAVEEHPGNSVRDAMSGVDKGCERLGCAITGAPECCIGNIADASPV